VGGVVVVDGDVVVVGVVVVIVGAGQSSPLGTVVVGEVVGVSVLVSSGVFLLTSSPDCGSRSTRKVPVVPSGSGCSVCGFIPSSSGGVYGGKSPLVRGVTFGLSGLIIILHSWLFIFDFLVNSIAKLLPVVNQQTYYLRSYLYHLLLIMLRAIYSCLVSK
jgi:hypothetical protein